MASRLNLFASATALAALLLPALHASADATIRNGDRVAAGAPFSGFTLVFRPGSSEGADAATVMRALAPLNAALARGEIVQASNGAPVRDVTLGFGRGIAANMYSIVPSRAVDGAAGTQLLRALAKLPFLATVEPILRAQGSLVPNDPLYTAQWGLVSASYGINPQLAWDLTRGKGTTVAVLDSGIASHSDLNASIVPGYDFVSDLAYAHDGNGRDSDATDPGNWCDIPTHPGYRSYSNWHGLSMAGVVGATTHNGKYTAGVAPETRVMPVRVLGACNSGDSSDVADAISWSVGESVGTIAPLARDKIADVLNLSFSGRGLCPSDLQAAIDRAVTAGVTVVTSAGNDNADAALNFPGNCVGVINIGGTTAAGARWALSNYGDAVDFMAPADHIMMLEGWGNRSYETETYGFDDGTSASAAYVSGVVALLQSYRLLGGQPRLAPDEVWTALYLSSKSLPACGTGCGIGLVNTSGALDVGRRMGAPAAISVGSDGKARFQRYWGAPWTTVPGAVSVASAIPTRALGYVALGTNGRLYSRRSLHGGDWALVASNNTQTMTAIVDYQGGLLAFGTDGYLYRRADLSAPWVRSLYSPGFKSLSVSPDNTLVAVSHDGGVWTARDLQSFWSGQPLGRTVSSVAVLSNGVYLALDASGALFSRPSLDPALSWTQVSGASNLRTLGTLSH